MALDSALARLSVCDLETIGRVSGRAHTVEMWFAADPDRNRIYVMSGGRDEADWVRNVRRTSAVRVRLGRDWRSGNARVIEGSPDEGLARRLWRPSTRAGRRAGR
jgi:deazaflavin-dependent oxidoreductase (nitroreductase family)